MAGYSWTEEEKALVVWFASIGLTHSTISQLLRHRSFDRSLTAVRNKIAELRKEFGLGCASNKLDIWAVDNWIRQLPLNCDSPYLLMPTLLDQQIIMEVRLVILIQKCELSLV
jgi:hypothetical protein